MTAEVSQIIQPFSETSQVYNGQPNFLARIVDLGSSAISGAQDLYHSARQNALAVMATGAAVLGGTMGLEMLASDSATAAHRYSIPSPAHVMNDVPSTTTKKYPTEGYSAVYQKATTSSYYAATDRTCNTTPASPAEITVECLPKESNSNTGEYEVFIGFPALFLLSSIFLRLASRGKERD